uniref:Uncharacterized protein n=1 Tax=Zeugodacus cucurbitae TaxID=28588 RepID=A0A0A1WDT4_ZEUCU
MKQVDNMNNSGTEHNGVIVCGPPASPDPDYTYHNIVTICGQPASPDPEDIDSRKQVSPSEMTNYQTITTYGTPPSASTVVTQVRGPSTPPNPEYSYNNTVTTSGQLASPVDNRIAVSPTPETVNYETITDYGSPPSAYGVDSYESSRIKPYSPISPAESYTYNESKFESSNLPGPELLSTPVKESASSYMMEPHVVTPTTSNKRSPRRNLNFRNPNLMYDLEDISEDESNSGEPLAQKPMTEDIVMDNESMRAWINAIATLYKSRNE